MTAFAFALLWLTLWLAGDTPIGRTMRRVLVAWPAGMLTRLSWRAACPLLAVAAVGAAIFWLLDGEALLLFGFAAPEVLAYAAMFDLGLMAEVIGLALVASTMVRLSGVVHAVRAAIMPRHRRRARRVRLSRPVPANDDDEDGRRLRVA